VGKNLVGRLLGSLEGEVTRRAVAVAERAEGRLDLGAEVLG
jgi:hypothetical protein